LRLAREEIQLISLAIFGNTFNLIWGVQPSAQKFSAFLAAQIICVFAASRAHERGVGHRHERWARDAMDVDAL
jgi:hypothetical protein